jgi:hypothetical protein
MNGFGDFTNGGFPLPQGPVYYPGMGYVGDFVKGGFPLPMTSVYMPSSNGSLPKAPPMPRAAIAHGSSGPASPSLNGLRGVSGLRGIGCGCGPRGFGGMGTLATTDFGLVNGDTIIPQASLPSFLQGDNWISGLPNLYTAGVVVVGVFMFMGGKKGRR